MRTRIGLAALLLSATAVTAKPPGLPRTPLSDGTEPPPVAREFYQMDAKPACERVAYTDPAAFWATVERVKTMLAGWWK